MKILFETDGSEHARAALDAIARRPWPARTQVRVVSVAHPVHFVGDPFLTGAAIYAESVMAEEKRAAKDSAAAAADLHRRAPGLRVSKVALAGSPQEQIVQGAERWNADLVVMGSHGRSPLGRFLLGSVAHAVLQHAPCSVEVVRSRRLLGAARRRGAARAALPKATR